MRIRTLCVGLVSLAMTVSATKAEAQGRVRGLVRLGADYGGDPVIQFQYADGSKPDVTAGGGLLFAGGGTMKLIGSVDQSLDVEGTVGVKYRTIPPASNQSASWIRFPVEGMLMYRTPFGLRAGGGVAMHFANVLEAQGAAANGRLEFKSTPGYVVQTAYVFGQKWALDMRYTMMKYELAQGGTGKVNANSLGAGLSYAFGGTPRSALKAQ